MNTAIKKITGKDPDSYLADYRNHNNMRMQELKEALGVESRATIFNPKYIKDVLKGGKSSAEGITELVTNAFGWEATRSEVIDDEFWNQVHDLYIIDKENLGVQDFFERENPAAMQEITAIMLETARKGFWKASSNQLDVITQKYIDLVERFGLEPSGFSGNNSKLQDYISKRLPENQKNSYQKQIQESKTSDKSTESKVLRKENTENKKEKINLNGLWIGIGGIIAFIILIIFIKKRRKN
ncbi:cobaltochelatase subunit CobN [Capnocytophaga catalasegens]|uniref:CobN/magnesium chelatase domain-containing protein n=1 Tax=Capnocytophaga catalasegens TaxID=1004260 RepID=A0AAV5ASS6_9FLAO|nr:cobaltochelatase subunit CobN [Capnocytophaga catalasegens]GIZ16425.1 hypothetical protein RCZ03_24250 [Capnocytophaga catalasegens]GJM50336.1 hypothetical protein RCZ15_13090 [Capnocytophaga catalasegens]GJM53853.1 hypothetical protein RCZ16_21690 [Capnocytophaga catalasegens]